MLSRFRDSDIDSKIWHYQFGFKKVANVSDNIFIARKYLDAAFANKNGRLALLALDWAKAFDSIMLEPMFDALKRFSLPDAFIHMLKGIYTSRTLYVQDASCSSDIKH